MSRIFLTVSLAFAFASSALAGGIFVWPPPSPPAGANTAVIPSPNTKFFDIFQQKCDQARKAPSINLIFDGDTNTDYPGTPNAPWKNRYAKLGAVDFAIAGDHTEHLLWRLHNGQLDGLHPKLVVLMIGVENLKKNSAEEIAGAIKLIVEQYQKDCPDAVILLEGLLPCGEKPTDEIRIKAHAVNQVISQLGDGKKVIYLDLDNKFLNSDGTLSKEIFGDFIHLTQKGKETILPDAIQPVIDQVFGHSP